MVYGDLGHGIKTFGELNADRYDALYEEAMTKETQDSVETLVPDFSEYVDGQRLKGS